MRHLALRSVLLASVACGATTRAAAHAPLPRGVALGGDGNAVALALPGFGLVHRPRANAPFHYVCDALLFGRVSIEQPTLLFLPDGSLLVAGSGGVRTLSADGCPLPSDSPLRDATVIALAAQPGTTTNLYAVVAGDRAGIWRSLDGGQQWQLRAPLQNAELVTGLAVDPDDGEVVYLSQDALPGSFVRVSRDGGSSFDSHPQAVARTLLAVAGGATPYLWSRARDALTVGNNGWAIARAAQPEGPWQTMTRVAYYGGFVLGPGGMITVGDELGGVVRSQDHGQTFVPMGDEVPVTALAQVGDTLWASTSGLPGDPALQSMPPEQAFAPVTSMDAVNSLVTCADEVQVQRVCAAAWAEWERDVLMRPVTAPDAGPSPTEPQDAGTAVDAGSEAPADASQPAPRARDKGGCSLHVDTNGESHGGALLALLGLAWYRRRRR